MSISISFILDSVLITVARGSLLFACYKYLLRTVYHDLQEISATTSSGATNEDTNEEIELDILPGPSSSSHSSSRLGTLAGHSTLARLSFSICFAESCTLFMLFLAQESNIFSVESRMLNWRISMFLILAMILFIIPLTQNILLTYQSPLGKLSRRRSISTRVFMALLPYSLYLFMLSMIPLPQALITESFLTSSISRLVVLGTFIIGCLSGLGAARNAWEFMPSFSGSHTKIPSEAEIITAEEALQRIRNDIQVRRREERKLQEVEDGSSSSWMSRVTSSMMGNSELTSVQREITGLLALEYQMDRNLESMRALFSSTQYNQSLQGKAFLWARRAFAAYCVFRTLSSIFNIIAPFRSKDLSEVDSPNSYPDLIAHFLTYLFSLLPFIHLSEENIAAISQQVGLLLVGVIILSTVRFVLKGVTRFLKITSQNLGASLLLLILAQLMGTYLLSTLVQLRTAFPPGSQNSATTSTNVLSTLPAYEVFGNAFDYSYLVSAFATGAYLWVDDRVNGSV